VRFRGVEAAVEQRARAGEAGGRARAGRTGTAASARHGRCRSGERLPRPGTAASVTRTDRERGCSAGAGRRLPRADPHVHGRQPSAARRWPVTAWAALPRTTAARLLVYTVASAGSSGERRL